AIERDRPLVFRNGLLATRLRTSHLALGEMRPCVVWRQRQRPRDRLIRALQVAARRVALGIEYSGRQRGRQPTPSLGRTRVEGYRPLEKAHRLGIALSRRRLCIRSAAPQNV